MVLKELIDLPGVSGNENAVRDYILKEAAARGFETTVDRLGSVFAQKKGAKRGKRVMLDAHMDEIGLIVIGIRDDGLISYEPVGGIDPRVMVSKRVLVGKDAIPGVIGAKAIHLQDKKDREAPLDHKDLYVDIGAKDKKDAEKWVNPGDYVAFAPNYLEFGEGFVRAKALDDRIGCYNMLRLMENDYPADVVYSFSVQEEVGLRGAQVAAYRLQPDCALALEGTTANDLGDVPEHLQVCKAGKGVAISFMDRTSIAHPGLNRALRALATEKGIPWQIKTFVSGGNNAGAIQTARGPVPVCPLSVPCRYIHSPASVCLLADIESQYALAKAFLESGAAFEA